MLVYEGYQTDNDGVITFLGPFYSPTTVITSLRATDTASIDWFLETNQSSIVLGYGIGRSPKAGITLPFACNQSFINPTTHQGSESNTFQQIPITPNGPLYGPRAWIQTNGYYTFLTDIIYLSIQSTLNLDHIAVKERVIERETESELSIEHETDSSRGLTSVLVFNQVASKYFEIVVEVNDILVLNQEAQYSGLISEATNTLVLSQTVVKDKSHSETIEHELIITDEVEAIHEVYGDATSELVLDSITTAAFEYTLDVTNELTLDQEAIDDTIKLLAQSLTFTQSVGIIRNYVRNLTSALTLVQRLAPKYIYVLDVVSELELAQSPLSPSHQVVFDQLTIDQSVLAVGTIRLSVENKLYIAQELNTGESVYNLTLTDTLAFEQSTTRLLTQQDLSHVLTFSQSAVPAYGPTSTLTFDHELEYETTKSASNILTLSQIVSNPSDRSITTSQSLRINQSVIYTCAGCCNAEKYTPQLADGYTEFSETPPVYENTHTIVLTHSSLTLTLRTPDYDDQKTISFNKIDRETRGGKRIIHRQTSWPQSTRLTYTISYSSQDEVDDFLDFCEQTVGKQVGLLDYLNQQHQGIIILKDRQAVQASRANRQLSFEFEIVA